MQTVNTILLLAAFFGAAALWVKYPFPMFISFVVLLFAYDYLVETHILFWVAIPTYGLAGVAALLFVLGKKALTFFRNANEHVQEESRPWDPPPAPGAPTNDR